MVKENFFNNVYEDVNRIVEASNAGSQKAIVITPSIGSPHLSKAIDSVLKQDYKDILHLIVVDGSMFESAVNDIINRFSTEMCKSTTIPFNTGANGMNGHRIYASFPLLMNSDYVFFLDEDNWWDADHVSTLINLLEDRNIDWAYSMRKIFTYKGEYIGEDNCESIGPYLPYSSTVKNWPSYIDTNCYAFKRNTIVQTAHYWYHPLRADRYFFHHLSERFPRYLSSKKYSANYRLKKDGPVSEGYIKEGNDFMIKKYGSSLPWI